MGGKMAGAAGVLGVSQLVNIYSNLQLFFNSERVQDFINPYRKKQEEKMARIQELKELEAIAAEYGHKNIYKSLNVEMNQLLMEYLGLCFLDGLKFLLPHVVAIWILGIKFSVIHLPYIAPETGGGINIVVWYPVCAIIYYIVKMIRKRAKRVNKG